MVKPKKIINDPKDSVTDFIEGLLIQYPYHFAKLENHNVVLLQDGSGSTTQRVHILCGGGSGHEPSHAGFVGAGFLSGAICGGIFASPSVSSILAGIRSVAAGSSTTNREILLVVKNYTGDRLNFGLAAERANQEGIPTRMVVVCDDCALPRTKGITGARGVAGTVLVNKIAGGAAAAGKSLEEVANIARLTVSRMGSLGVALNSVTIPGAEQTNNRLDDATIEIGLGIHGEAGIKRSPLLSSDELAQVMIKTIQEYGRVVSSVDENRSNNVVPLFEKDDDLCILVNNLGGVSNFEMSIFARSCVKVLEGDVYGAKARRVLVGSYMTSFDMQGASLTILNLSGQSELVDFLESSTTAPAWKPFNSWCAGGSRPSATRIPEVRLVGSSAVTMPLPPLLIHDFCVSARKLSIIAAQKLVEAESMLTSYDTIVGDGDCGLTMKRGAMALIKGLENGSIPVNHPIPMFAAIADAISDSMGGTSGVLLEIMFRKMSSTLMRAEAIGAKDMAAAFLAGVEAVSLYGGASVGSRTMLDALTPSSIELCYSGLLKQAALKAREGADSTIAMAIASAGRSNYLSEETLLGTPDPGAVAVAIVMEGIADDEIWCRKRSVGTSNS